MANFALGEEKQPATNASALRITEQMRKEHRVFRSIGHFARDWLLKGNEGAGQRCQQEITALLQDPQHSVEVDFSGAKIAWLANKPANAMAILQDALSKRGAEKAPGMNWNVATRGKDVDGDHGSFWHNAIGQQRNAGAGEVMSLPLGARLECGAACGLYGIMSPKLIQPSYTRKARLWQNCKLRPQ
jgi:hypothetical protein